MRFLFTSWTRDYVNEDRHLKLSDRLYAGGDDMRVRQECLLE